MKTITFKFSKTKVREINNVLAQDDDATVWFDICDGFARIRVDNMLTRTCLLSVDSQKVKPIGPDGWSEGDFELPAEFFDALAEGKHALKIEAQLNEDHEFEMSRASRLFGCDNGVGVSALFCTSGRYSKVQMRSA